MFFEEYDSYKNFHYLRHCGVISVQRFRSHIRPLSPRLELVLKAQPTMIRIVTMLKVRTNSINRQKCCLLISVQSFDLFLLYLKGQSSEILIPLSHLYGLAYV